MLYSVDPVLVVFVANATVQGAGSEDENEMASVADVVHETVVEFSRAKSLDVEKDGETSKLEVNFEQTEKQRCVILCTM